MGDFAFKKFQKIAPEISNRLRSWLNRAQKLRNIDVLSQKNFGECISKIGVGASKKPSPPVLLVLESESLSTES